MVVPVDGATFRSVIHHNNHIGVVAHMAAPKYGVVDDDDEVKNDEYEDAIFHNQALAIITKRVIDSPHLATKLSTLASILQRKSPFHNLCYFQNEQRMVIIWLNI